MYRGYIKLWRKIEDSAIFSSEKGLKIWIWCLIKAGFEEKDVYIGRNKIHLEKGEFIFGRESASRQLNIGESTVWFWIKQLESDSYINIKSTSKYSLIKVLNWENYQSTDSQTDNKQKTNRKQIDTNKNVKDIIKNDKLIDANKIFFSSVEHRDAIINKIVAKGNKESIVRTEVDKFCNYWTEQSKSGKQRWEMEKTFEVEKRLRTWFSNYSKFNS